jgi:hypothetical protein
MSFFRGWVVGGKKFVSIAYIAKFRLIHTQCGGCFKIHAIHIQGVKHRIFHFYGTFKCIIQDLDDLTIETNK